jgi:hypothetical protein
MTRTVAVAVALGVACWTTCAFAQEKPRDDLDRLLEKLEKKDKDEPKTASTKDEKPGEKDKKSGSEKPKESPGAKDQSADKKTAELPKKDKDLDSLLEKLGGIGDKPDTKTERKPPGSESQAPPKTGAAKKDPLKEDQRKLDEVLEERSGKIKKKKQDSADESDSSPLGEAIKQMRDVEKRLDKTDTGEDTRKEQQEIVKKLDNILREMRRNQQGQQGQMRRVTQAGQRQGNQQGQQQGSDPNANARGVGPQRPARPSVRDVLTDDKNPWGNLPASLREELANVFKEQGLKNKENMIDKYFLSVSKKSAANKGD